MVTAFEHLGACFIPLLMHAYSLKTSLPETVLIFHSHEKYTPHAMSCIQAYDQKMYCIIQTLHILFVCVSLIYRLSSCSGHLQMKGTCMSVNNLFIFSVIFVSLSASIFICLHACTPVCMHGTRKLLNMKQKSS